MSTFSVRLGDPRPLPPLDSVYDAVIDDAPRSVAQDPAAVFIMGGPGEQGLCGVDIDCTTIDTYWLKGVAPRAASTPTDSVVKAWRNAGTALVDSAKAMTDLAAQFSVFLSFGAEL